MADAVKEWLEESVTPEAIERTLKKMRSEKDTLASGAVPVIRPNVILSNFIITLCSPLNEVRQKLEGLLEELTVLIPSRFFIVSIADEDIKELSTAVRLREIKSSSGKEFYSEEIFIQTSKSTLPLIPSLLRSLFASDVSIVSYVEGEPTGKEGSTVDELLHQLREICDLFLYDSKDFKNYSHAVSELFALRRIVRPQKEVDSKKLAPTSVRLRDINWYRHERLRSLLASLYDASSFSSSAIKEVEVILNQEKPSATGLILAGWLGEVLENESLVKIITSKPTSGQTESYIKVLVKGDGLELAVSQDGDFFEVTSGGSTRRLNSKSSSVAQLISLPIQSSGLDDYFTKSLERSLTVCSKWA